MKPYNPYISLTALILITATKPILFAPPSSSTPIDVLETPITASEFNSLARDFYQSSLLWKSPDDVIAYCEDSDNSNSNSRSFWIWEWLTGSRNEFIYAGNGIESELKSGFCSKITNILAKLSSYQPSLLSPGSCLPITNSNSKSNSRLLVHPELSYLGDLVLSELKSSESGKDLWGLLREVNLELSKKRLLKRDTTNGEASSSTHNNNDNTTNNEQQGGEELFQLATTVANLARQSLTNSDVDDEFVTIDLDDAHPQSRTRSQFEPPISFIRNPDGTHSVGYLLDESHQFVYQSPPPPQQIERVSTSVGPDDPFSFSQASFTSTSSVISDLVIPQLTRTVYFENYSLPNSVAPRRRPPINSLSILVDETNAAESRRQRALVVFKELLSGLFLMLFFLSIYAGSFVGWLACFNLCGKGVYALTPYPTSLAFSSMSALVCPTFLCGYCMKSICGDE